MPKIVLRGDFAQAYFSADGTSREAAICKKGKFLLFVGGVPARHACHVQDLTPWAWDLEALRSCKVMQFSLWCAFLAFGRMQNPNSNSLGS